MDFNAFELIQTALTAELAKQGFDDPAPLEDPDGRAVMFVAEDVAYSLLYHRLKRFETQKKFEVQMRHRHSRQALPFLIPP